MMGNLNLHGVTGVEVGEITELEQTGATHRLVKILLRDGERFEVDLFGETPDNLKTIT